MAFSDSKLDFQPSVNFDFLVALYFSPYFKLVAYDHDIYEHDFHCTTISDWLLTLVCN